MKILNFSTNLGAVALTAALQFFSSSAIAAVPLTLGTPLIGYDTGTMTFNSTTGEFSVNALPSSVFDPTMSPPIGFVSPAASGTETVTVNVIVDSSGTLIGGTAGDDIVIEGSVTLFPAGIPTPYNGILLTGEVVTFESQDSTGTTDEYSLTFSVTGGLLSSLYPGGGIGMNISSESSDFAGDFTVDFNGGAKGQVGDQDVIVIPDACTVEVEATCLVNIPPASLACEAKIAATTLLYTGPTMYGVDVTMNGSAGGSVTYTGVDLISGVTVLTSAADADMTIDARPGDLGPMLDIFIGGTGEWLHTSCSVPYVAGQPAPQNNGNPSPNWAVVSFVDKNGKVVDSTPTVPSTNCEIPPSGAGCFANGSPTSMTFEYTGGGCAMSDSEALTAGGTKAPTCTGAIDEALLPPQDEVSITVSGGLMATPSTVKLGDSFTLSGSFSSSTTVTFTDAVGGTEINTFHTSCSAPLEVGDVFGGMTMTLYNGEFGGTDVDFFYKVTNTGTTLIEDVLVDDVFDGSVPGSPIASMIAGEMQTLTRTVSLINSVENPVTVSAISGTAVCDSASANTIHETARPDKGSKGSKGSKRGSKKMKKKRKKGSHKRHKRSKGGHMKGSKGKGHYRGNHSNCSHN